MKTAVTLILSIISIATFAQNFQGKVIYQSSYQSKDKYKASSDLNNQFGTQITYYFKNGDYKIVTNGTELNWELYKNSENRVYDKWSSSEVISYNIGTFKNDRVLNAQLNKEVTTILGNKCDELVLTCKTGKQKFYFSSNYKLDASMFTNHNYNNWYDYVERANAVPLKMIIENNRFVQTTVAIDIKHMQIDAKEFELPAGAKTEQVAL